MQQPRSVPVCSGRCRTTWVQWARISAGTGILDHGLGLRQPGAHPVALGRRLFPRSRASNGGAALLQDKPRFEDLLQSSRTTRHGSGLSRTSTRRLLPDRRRARPAAPNQARPSCTPTRRCGRRTPCWPSASIRSSCSCGRRRSRLDERAPPTPSTCWPSSATSQPAMVLAHAGRRLVEHPPRFMAQLYPDRIAQGVGLAKRLPESFTTQPQPAGTEVKLFRPPTGRRGGVHQTHRRGSVSTRTTWWRHLRGDALRLLRSGLKIHGGRRSPQRPRMAPKEPRDPWV